VVSSSDIEPAVALERGRGKGVDLRLVGDVAECGTAADLGGQRLEWFGSTTGDHHGRTLFGEPSRHHLTHVVLSGGAEHHRDLACESAHHCLLDRWCTVGHARRRSGSEPSQSTALRRTKA
jgi:hypothetical protein